MFLFNRFLSDDSRFVDSALEFASKNTSGPDQSFARQYLAGCRYL